MPRVIACAEAEATSLAQCVADIADFGLDPRDPASVDHAGRALARLGNDRDFLGDLMLGELAARSRDEGPEGAEAYGPQVLMLSRPADNFFIRANIWPGAGDHALRASGRAAFQYDLPHDHNFHFVTLGYFGPGYWSDYYEYDYAEVAGWTGEPADLRFHERSRLAQGKVMHYRAHRDVHLQLPADSLSVSLNVMHTGGAQGWLDQYRFDLGTKRIAGMLGRGSSEAFLRIAVGLGGAEAADLAHRFGQSHPSDRLRLCAWDALADAQADAGARDVLWARAERAGSVLVAREAAARRALLSA